MDHSRNNRLYGRRDSFLDGVCRGDYCLVSCGAHLEVDRGETRPSCFLFVLGWLATHFRVDSVSADDFLWTLRSWVWRA